MGACGGEVVFGKTKDGLARSTFGDHFVDVDIFGYHGIFATRTRYLHGGFLCLEWGGASSIGFFLSTPSGSALVFAKYLLIGDAKVLFENSFKEPYCFGIFDVIEEFDLLSAA